MKKYILIFMVFGFFISLSAQKQLNNWLMGYNAGITWNTTRSMQMKGLDGTPDTIMYGIPTELRDPLTKAPLAKVETAEGCLAMSDYRGNLLFYSDGIKVWNKNHEIMSNTDTSEGQLTGHYSSAQSGIVIPYPGQEDKYIVFTLDYWHYDRLAYSIINMNLNGGLGGIEGTRNIYLQGHKGLTGESVSVVRHPNLRDYWLVAPGKGNRNLNQTETYLNVWKIDSQGVHSTAIHSLDSIDINISAIPNGSGSVSINGYLSFDAYGKYFAWPITGGEPEIRKMTVFGSFDPVEGKFTKVRRFSPTDPGYGAEFSLSGKYLYLPEMRYFHISGDYPISSIIKVYDFEELLNSPDPDATSYRTITTDLYQGTAQMGPDGRIYIPSPGGFTNTNQEYGKLSRTMIVIDNPEEVDNLRVYQTDSIVTYPAVLTVGVPTFSKSWLYVTITGETKFCERTSQEYTVTLDEYSSDSDYIVWSWGDTTPTETHPVVMGVQTNKASHVYDKAGLYKITAECFKNGDPDAIQTHTLYIEVVNCAIPVNPHIQSGHNYTY